MILNSQNFSKVNVKTQQRKYRRYFRRDLNLYPLLPTRFEFISPTSVEIWIHNNYIRRDLNLYSLCREAMFFDAIYTL